MRILSITLFFLGLLSTAHTQDADRLAKLLEKFPEADADGDGTLTQEEVRAFREKMPQKDGRKREKEKTIPKLEPTHADISYGPHERNVFDIWLPESPLEKEATSLPLPVFVFFHGGGFVGGDKSSFSPQIYMEAGIACVSANYRFVDGSETLSPVPMQDGARVIQTLRHRASEWNIDGGRIAVSGSSAGAVMAMWIAYKDDLKNDDSEDPVERQSSRVNCVVPINGPTNLLPDWIVKHLGGSSHVHGSFPKMFGVDADGELSPDVLERIQSSSPWEFVSEDDPPTLLIYNSLLELEELPLPEDTSTGKVIHHPFFGLALKEKLDALGVECEFRHSFDPRGNPAIPDYLRSKFRMID